MYKFIPLKDDDPSKIYTFLHKITSGKNKNELYKVKHKKTGEIFIAKIIHKNLDIYHNQIKSLKKFENPYLVQYYNSFELKDRIWIITEYCDCGSVQDIMKITNKCYKEVEIASIMAMVLKGLQYLHLQNKFHGGIKSSNILLNNNGVVKLSDFNISEQLLLNDDIINNEHLKNNIEKCPPELIGKNKLANYSVKSDIWYLGLTCVELAEGTLDFKNGKIITEKNNQNGMKNSNLWSLEFIDFIQKCLNENPLNRPTAVSLLNHPFIINNNKGKILIKKKINSIKALIDIYREKIDEQEEKNNLNEIGKDSLEIASFNEIINKTQSEEIIKSKNYSVNLNINKNEYKQKSLLINRNSQIEKYKKIKKFKIGSQSIQIQNSKRKNNFFINNKASSKKKKIKTSIIKKEINSNEIFAINESSLRKKRRSLINKYLKSDLKLHEYKNEIFNGNRSKLNNTLDNLHSRNNLMKLLNKFDRDKKGKNKVLNKSQRIKNIENIFNLLKQKSKINNAIKETNISKNSNNNIIVKDKEKKANDKSLSSVDSKRFSNAEKNSKNLNNTENSNLQLKTRNKKSNGGNPSLSDLNGNNNQNYKKVTQKKNKVLRNLLLGDKQKQLPFENEIINIDNNKGFKMNNNGIKIYNNEYIFKLNNSANIYNKYVKKREKFPDTKINNNLNKTSKISYLYYFNPSEIQKIQKPPLSQPTKKNQSNKTKIKRENKITYKINTNYINNNINESSNINNDSIKENEKSNYIFNINNTDININLNNNNNYYNINNSKYNNKSYSYNNNPNISFLSEEELKHLCLDTDLNKRELPELITELAGLENKMNQEIQKIREEYGPIIMQHKEGIKFLKQNPFLKNIKEFKNFEIFKNKMNYNNNDDFASRSVSSSVHNLNKIKISFYRANDIEELNISANKYLFDKTEYYNQMMKL